MDFEALLRNINITLTTEQLAQFDLYASLLVEWNEKFNLTAITDREGIFVKHFYDSLLLQASFKDTDTLCDVGSGAGFPGIPLKIAYPQLKVSLMEPTGKRCVFLNEVISQLKLTDIEVLNCRAEEYKEKKFTYTTARAVSRLNILSELCLPLTEVNGHFIAMKGSQGHDELKEAANAIKKLGGSVREVKEIMLPDQQERILIDIEKVRETPAGYPRRYAQIKKKPL
ncbi:MAG: 16S rRNA (guanine(527)-N(7))-methyltransferase RsmG [Erysipelotrichaceae bacterium]|nr:16S rRNA (guanine(527)-N(7))-methyltransferase RsmG [Erysipelotrichaceae bacterium]